MKHLNGNMLCAVTVLTTGFDITKHQLISICIVPVHEFETQAPPPYIFNVSLRNKILDFGPEMKPQEVRRCREDLLKAIDPDDAAYGLEQWFDSLNLRDGKKIMPLAYNWAHVSSFLIKWLGYDSFSLMFDWRYRDLLPSTLVMNDISYVNNKDKYPYPKHGFRYIVSCTNQEYKRPADVRNQAKCLIGAYRYLTHKHNWIGI